MSLAAIPEFMKAHLKRARKGVPLLAGLYFILLALVQICATARYLAKSLDLFHLALQLNPELLDIVVFPKHTRARQLLVSVAYIALRRYYGRLETVGAGHEMAFAMTEFAAGYVLLGELVRISVRWKKRKSVRFYQTVFQNSPPGEEPDPLGFLDDEEPTTLHRRNSGE